MLPIQKKYVNYNYSRRSSKPKYIVIHDTGNPGASANNHYLYFNGGNRGSSADFFVDSDNIIQIVDTDVNYSWAVGDGKGVYGITNANSCSIEMCLEKDGRPSEATVKNTIELTRYLMSYYDISIEGVKRHFDCSRKSCPYSFMANDWEKWYNFKYKVSNPTVDYKKVHVGEYLNIKPFNAGFGIYKDDASWDLWNRIAYLGCPISAKILDNPSKNVYKVKDCRYGFEGYCYIEENNNTTFTSYQAYKEKEASKEILFKIIADGVQVTDLCKAKWIPDMIEEQLKKGVKDIKILECN